MVRTHVHCEEGLNSRHEVQTGYAYSLGKTVLAQGFQFDSILLSAIIFSFAPFLFFLAANCHFLLFITIIFKEFVCDTLYHVIFNSYLSKLDLPDTKQIL